MAYTTIKKPSDYFNTKLYTGNGSTQSITGVNFESDLTWIKSRSSGAWHNLFDAVRGATKRLQVNSDGAESTETNSLTSFDSNGFTVGSSGDVNGSGNSTVAWNWKAGTTSGITQGSATITPSSYSINATSGFSIIKWTGTNANATIPHGLGVAPKMIIIRRLDSTSDWVVYHSSIGNTKRIVLNSSAVQSGASSGWFNNTSPTANVFSVGTDGGSNGSTDNYIAYCFAEKTGYSKIGDYTGNGNADGTFIYCGFKPAWVMIKPTTVAQNWQIHDTKRDGYNPNNDNLSSNNSNSEADNKFIDIVSNGFKLRRSDVLNESGDPYIYIAFAEEPLVANVGASIPATAR